MTTNQPPRRAKVLTRLKITEVSAVDRGAGENCKIVLSKRDDDASRLNLVDVFTGKITAAEALGIHVDKSAEGDEAERVVDNDGDGDAGGNDHYASKVADLLVESGKHPDRSITCFTPHTARQCCSVCPNNTRTPLPCLSTFLMS